MKAMGITFWIVAIALVSLIIFTDVHEIRTFDKTAIKSEQLLIVHGIQKTIHEDVSLVAFLGREYDIVVIGKGDSDNKIVFSGKSDKEYYGATEKIPLSTFQEIRELKMNSDKIEIVIGKNIGDSVLASTIIVVILGIIGALFFFMTRKEE